jgi:hypothetical protein
MMNNPFKLLAGFALVSVAIAGLVGWLMTVRPARDALGTIPTASSDTSESSKAAEQAAAAQQEAAYGLNKPAPAIQLPGVDRGRFSLASYRGKAPVILYFFATW